MTKPAARLAAGCALVVLATPGAALARDHGRVGHLPPRVRPAGVCRALDSSRPLRGRLAGLSAGQLATLRGDCAAIQTAQQNAVAAVRAARQQEEATLLPAVQAVRSACGSSRSSVREARHARSAACLAALSSLRSAERSARAAFNAAVQSALASVRAAVRQLAADLAGGQSGQSGSGGGGVISA